MRLNHSIVLQLRLDKSGPVEVTRDLFSFHISPAVIFALVVNLAAIGLVMRDVAATARHLAIETRQDWDAGIYAIMAVIFPFRARAYAIG